MSSNQKPREIRKIINGVEHVLVWVRKQHVEWPHIRNNDSAIPATQNDLQQALAPSVQSPPSGSTKSDSTK
jgi:hypothetical protein